MTSALDRSTNDGAVIDSFTGTHAWLSNFADMPVEYGGRTYPTAEHAFAAAKTLDDTQRERIAHTPTPAAAKKAGRSVQLRPDWDSRVRFDAMGQIVRSKFAPAAAAALLAGTGDALLVEGDTWHDQTWGDCRCAQHREQPGRNELGLALMAARAEARGSGAGRWVRVGFTGHRDLTARAERWVVRELGRVLRKLRDDHDSTTLINGMAMGADLIAAEVAADAGLGTWAYVPFPDQTARWPESWIGRHELALKGAARTVTLGASPAIGGPRGRYVRLLLGRNEMIVRDCDVLVAVRDRTRTSGGTTYTDTYARNAGRPVITLDPVTETVTVGQ